jgi:hypothetical protein
VKYGSHTLDIAKGKLAIEVASEEDLITAINIVKAVDEAGELDVNIEAASGSLKDGSKK